MSTKPHSTRPHVLSAQPQTAGGTELMATWSSPPRALTAAPAPVLQTMRWSSVDEMLSGLGLRDEYLSLLEDAGFDEIDEYVLALQRDLAGTCLVQALGRAGVRVGHAVKMVNSFFDRESAEAAM